MTHPCNCVLVRLILCAKLSLISIYVIENSANIINPLNAELNPIYHLLALLEAHHILHVNRIRVKDYVYYQLIALRNVFKIHKIITPSCFGYLC